MPVGLQRKDTFSLPLLRRILELLCLLSHTLHPYAQPLRAHTAPCSPACTAPWSYTQYTVFLCAHAPQGTPSAHCTPPEVTHSTLHACVHVLLRARTEHTAPLCAHPLRAHTIHTGTLCAHIPESIHS